jgi:hypothetical protein
LKKVLITGSKSIEDYALLAAAMQNCNFPITEVVCGNAKGIETLGYRWAQCFAKPVKQIPAEWDHRGNGVGIHKLIQYCDAAVIIWDGRSKGTRRVLDHIIQSQKPYYLRLTHSED